jgi:hypothetical protein
VSDEADSENGRNCAGSSLLAGARFRAIFKIRAGPSPPRIVGKRARVTKLTRDAVFSFFELRE